MQNLRPSINSVGVKDSAMAAAAKAPAIPRGNESRRGNIGRSKRFLPAAKPRITATCKVPKCICGRSIAVSCIGRSRPWPSGGKAVDFVSDPLGFRTIEFTKDNGFLLNGKRLQIQGTCNHHDLGALGSAVNRRALERQLQMLKEMGDNALRTSHNPPDAGILGTGRRNGLCRHGRSLRRMEATPRRNTATADFSTIGRRRDLVAMIHRDRNHPVVIMWSIGNEIPEQVAGPRRRPQCTAREMAKRLSDIAHREDPTRPVTSACNNPDRPSNRLCRCAGRDGHQLPHSAIPKEKGRMLIASETASALSTRGEYGLYLDDKRRSENGPPK